LSVIFPKHIQSKLPDDTVIYITDDTPRPRHTQNTGFFRIGAQRRLKTGAPDSEGVGDAVIRKFINALGEGAVFDPVTLRILIGAFDDAWASLLNSGAPFAAENYAERARAILAKHIIQAAKNGERNQHKLSEGALLQLARTNLNKPLGDEQQ
jgi:hypothetical protein